MRSQFMKRVLGVTLVLFALVVTHANVPAAILHGQEQGAQGSQNSPIGAQPDESAQPPTGNDGGGGPAGGTSRLGNEGQRAATPWAAIIGSFIAGLAVGALVFRNRRRAIAADRDDFRRAA